jgi:hypothetical protein
MTTRWLVLACVIGACGSPPPPPPVVPKGPPPGKLGEACTATAALAQGTCAAGLQCLTGVPGGSCTSTCPCHEGACWESLDWPEMCAKSCASDADCRGGEGFACDAAQKVCAPAGALAPKPPQCSAAAPARKSFGKVTALSTAKAGKTTYGPTAALDKEGSLVALYTVGVPLAGPATIGVGKAAVVKDELQIGAQDQAVALDHEDQTDPALENDRGGRLFLATRGWNGGAAQVNAAIGVATSDDGVSWSKVVTAADCGAGCGRPFLAVGPDKSNLKADAIYVFFASGGGLRSVRSSDGGGSFAPSVPVAPGLVGDAEVTSSGKIHVVYIGGGGNKLGDVQNGVYYVNSGDGGASYTPPVRISAETDPVPVLFSSPRVVVDVARTMLYAVYPQGTPDGKWEIVLASSKDGGVTWARTTVNDDSPCASHMLPATALDPATGKVHVAWVENRSGVGAVVYSSCMTGGVKCAKNEQISDSPFASYGFGRESNKWLGDTIDLVVDTKHKLLHAVWTQTVDEGGALVGRVMHAAAKLK